MTTDSGILKSNHAVLLFAGNAKLFLGVVIIAR